MKMILWKEFRENFKWAVLALLALTLAEFYVLSSERANFQNNSQNDLTLCGSSFLLVTSFGSVAIGAFLGAIQILPELRRDRWAALLHRPVSRGVIFFGKVFAGLILYVAATTLPFLASACYVAMPGEFPVPVVPGMLLPGLSDVLLGVVFYFAALLLCLHPGRWFGTRGAILLAAAAVFLAHIASGTSFVVFYWPLGAALFFLLGAWGAMLGNGPVENRPWPGRIAFVLIVLVGVQVAFAVIEVGVEFIPWPWAKPPPAVTYTQFEVTQDGQVLQLTSQGDGANQVVTDMAGKVITDERYVGNNNYQNFCQFNYLGFDLRMKLRGYYSANLSLRTTLRYLQPIRRSYGEKEIWYLLPGRNYLIGYDMLSRRCIGICDQEGFKPSGAPPRPFAQPLKSSIFSSGWKPTLFWSGSRIYAFDFSERTMTPFFNAGNETIDETSNFGGSSRQDAPAHVAVALENEIRFFDDKGAPVLTLPYLHDPARWGNVMIAANKAIDRIYLQSGPGFDDSDREETIPTFLDEIDLHGNVLHSYSHPNANPYLSLAQSNSIDKVFSSLLPFGPMLVYDLYSRLFPGGPADSEAAVHLEPLAITLRDLGILFVIGVALAVFAFRWARLVGMAESRARKWALFVFLFGPAGLLTFRLASDWPTRVLCPSCKSPRTAEGETCSSCDQAWPPPETTGTEILGPASIGA